jgi:hypothetical protein
VRLDDILDFFPAALPPYRDPVMVPCDWCSRRAPVERLMWSFGARLCGDCLYAEALRRYWMARPRALAINGAGYRRRQRARGRRR